MGAKVEQLEDPPDRGRNEEESHVLTPAAREQRRARAPINQPIHEEAVAQPHREKAPVGARTRQHPVERPENGDQTQSEPSMPGEFQLFDLNLFGLDIGCHVPSVH